MSADDEVEGTLILSDETARSLSWHHSVEFDGHTHTTACRREIDCDDIRDIELDPRDAWRSNVTPSNGCPTCYDSVFGLRQFSDEEQEQEVRTDGGIESAETEWSRHVTSRDEIEELADDFGVGTHNMWVDVRDKDFATGEYDPVLVEVTVSVTGTPAATDGGSQAGIGVEEEYGDRLNAAVAVMEGEADELAGHRPHRDPHFYDIEEGLRHKASELDAFLQEEYYR